MAVSAKRITKLSRAALRADRDKLEALRPRTDAEIEAEAADDPMCAPIISGEGWRGAGIIVPETTVVVSVRVDRAVLEHFRARDPVNPEGAMAAVLTAHVKDASED